MRGPTHGRRSGGGQVNNDLPTVHGSRRLVGITADGQKINNVTAENRFDVDKGNPWLTVALMSEDLSRQLHEVYIPRTREMPDAVLFEGRYYEVVDTRLNPPQYRECFVAEARKEKPKKDIADGQQTE